MGGLGNMCLGGVKVEAVAQAIAEFPEWGFRGLRYRRDLRKSFW